MNRIILVADSDPRTKVVGGIGTYAYHLATTLSKLKKNVVFVGKKQAEEKKNSVQFDVVLANKEANESNMKFFSSLFSFAKKNPLKKDDILHVQRPDWLVPFKHTNALKIITLHGSHYKNIKMKKPFFLVWLYQYFEYIGMKHADTIIAVNDETRIEFQKRFPFAKHKIRTIPVGVDTTLFSSKNKKHTLRKQYNYSIDETIFLYVGRLSVEKQIHLMIENITKNERLIIIGEGEEKEKLKHVAKGKNVEFLGSKNQKELVEYYSLADALFLFSTHEGLPTVVLESFSCGLPVITTPVGELPKLVTAKTGILVKNNEIRQAIDTFLKNQEKKSYKKNCMQEAKRYDWQSVAKQICDEVYK